MNVNVGEAVVGLGVGPAVGAAVGCQDTGVGDSDIVGADEAVVAGRGTMSIPVFRPPPSKPEVEPSQHGHHSSY